MAQHDVTPAQIWSQIWRIVAPDRSFCLVAILYGVAISVLTLTVPLCVQVLVGSVANTAQTQPVVVLALVLFVLLALSGVLIGLQTHVMELFERRFFCRITSEIVMRNIYARYSFFESVNREDLVNRYFEIMTVQKSMGKLIVGGSALVLQTVVGFVVVSAYHPVFLVFNTVVILLLLLVLRIWGSGAVRSVVSLSQAKYGMAHDLEELARGNAFFKSGRTIRHALAVAEASTATYVAAHRAYFRFRFSQIAAMLAIYALANALLLGLGGWLVVGGELALGQLVAAELILSVVFVGLARSGEYLDNYYELCAAAAKLSEFAAVPLERDTGRVTIAAERADIAFVGVVAHRGDLEYRLDFQVAAGATVLVSTQSQTVQKLVVDLLLRHREPEAGRITVAGVNLADCRLHDLRDRVAVLDSSGVLERSIADYLALGDPAITRAQMREALAATGLEAVVDRLPHGFETRLGPFGYPLSRSETLRLKLSAILLAEPRVLLITEIFDSVSPDRRAIFEHLRRVPGLTTLYFSNRRDLDVFDAHLFLGWERSDRFDSLAALCAFEANIGRLTGRVA